MSKPKPDMSGDSSALGNAPPDRVNVEAGGHALTPKHHSPVKRGVGDPIIGDVILDRAIHRAQRLELKGPSMRKRHNPEVSAAVSTGLDERL
jgi:hypothetical protein